MKRNGTRLLTVQQHKTVIKPCLINPSVTPPPPPPPPPPPIPQYPSPNGTIDLRLTDLSLRVNNQINAKMLKLHPNIRKAKHVLSSLGASSAEITPRPYNRLSHLTDRAQRNRNELKFPEAAGFRHRAVHAIREVAALSRRPCIIYRRRP
jgi:hypothetical protein